MSILFKKGELIRYKPNPYNFDGLICEVQDDFEMMETETVENCTVSLNTIYTEKQGTAKWSYNFAVPLNCVKKLTLEEHVYYKLTGKIR